MGGSGGTWEDRRQEDNHFLRTGDPECSPVKWASSSPSFRSGMKARWDKGRPAQGHAAGTHRAGTATNWSDSTA